MIIDPEAGTPERQRECEIGIVESIDETGAVARNHRLSQHTMAISRALFEGLFDLQVGTVVRVACTRPEFWGFHNQPKRPWTATRIVSIQEQEQK